MIMKIRANDVDKFKDILTEKEYILGKQLQEIIDTDKVLKTNAFSEDQWIQYNSEKSHFEYEDNVKIGSTVMEVIMFLRSDWQKKWSEKAEWYISERI